MRTVSYVVLFFTTFFLCHADPSGKGAVQQESFVVKKKKGGKAGRKSKEQACRGFAQCVKTGSELVERVARVQGFGLERTAQYLDGDDPFSGVKKSDIRELVRKSEQLEKKISQLCQECDSYMNYATELFAKHIEGQIPQR